MTAEAMNTETNNGAETTEAPKKRGRPKGVAREVYVVCVGIIEGDDGPKLIADQFQVEGTKETSREELRAAGVKMYAKKYDDEPQEVLGPFFEVKGKYVPTKKRDSLKLDPEEVLVTNKKARADYNGWRVTAFYLQDRDDAAFIMFKEEISPGEKRKPKPQPKVIELKNLANIQAIS